jgi:hypothetical protein
VSNEERFKETFGKNFGRYVLALVIILIAYSAVGMVAPRYANMFAIVTLFGIVLYVINWEERFK